MIVLPSFTSRPLDDGYLQDMLRVMVDIAAPRYADDYAEKAVDCEFAIKPAFEDLIRHARTEGWSEDEVAAALLSLARWHIKGIIANREAEPTTAHAVWAMQR